MSQVIAVKWCHILAFLAALLSLLVYNEFVVYYVMLVQCTWPILEVEKVDFSIRDGIHGNLKAMILADIHLLGKQGHWFDKMRREWQMERAFQTALTVFEPDVVFILGDLFDEGKWCSDAEFTDYVERYEKMFQPSKNTNMQVVVGNHDIGFHYMIDEHKRRRFDSAFNTPSVRLFRAKDNIFVLLNSMAFEGDHCEMCEDAEKRLRDITMSLKCSQGKVDEAACRNTDKFKYTKPVILQHFPMYRKSDAACTGVDAAPPEAKDVLFREKHDCLSQDASNKIFQWLKPRLILSGHTHNFCYTQHPNGTHEWTVPSFNWRNNKQPSFLLLTLNNNNHDVNKCYLPCETTVIWTYIIGCIVIVLWFLFPRRLLWFPSRGVKVN